VKGWSVMGHLFLWDCRESDE